MGNVLIGIGKVLDGALSLYLIIVVVSAVISWVNPDPYNPLVRFLRQATEPLYYRIRRLAPWLRLGGIDLSPLVVIFLIEFLRWAVAQNLIDYGMALRRAF